MAPSILMALALCLAQPANLASQQSAPAKGAAPAPAAQTPTPLSRVANPTDSLIYFLGGAQQPNTFSNLANQRVDAHQHGLEALSVEFLRVNTPLAGWTHDLGLEVAAVDDPLRAQLELKDTDVLLVTAVKQGSPAAQAELQVHDVLVRPTPPEAGKAARLNVVRRGKPITALLAAPPPAKDWWIGVTAASLDEALRAQLGVAEGKGLILQEVLQDSPAVKVGLSKHDVVLGTEGGPDFAAADELAKAVQAANGGALRLRLIRAAKPIIVVVTPTERPKAKETADAAAHAAWVDLVNARVATAQPELGRFLYLDAVTRVAAAPAGTDARIHELAERLRRLADETRAAQEALAQLQRDLADGKKVAEPKK